MAHRTGNESDNPETPDLIPPWPPASAAGRAVRRRESLDSGGGNGRLALRAGRDKMPDLMPGSTQKGFVE